MCLYLYIREEKRDNKEEKETGTIYKRPREQKLERIREKIENRKLSDKINQ
jgi:hypothetical protein